MAFGSNYHHIDQLPHLAGFKCPHCGKSGESSTYRDEAIRATRFSFRMHEANYQFAVNDFDFDHMHEDVFQRVLADNTERAMRSLNSNVKECPVLKHKIKQAHLKASSQLWVKNEDFKDSFAYNVEHDENGLATAFLNGTKPKASDAFESYASSLLKSEQANIDKMILQGLQGAGTALPAPNTWVTSTGTTAYPYPWGQPIMVPGMFNLLTPAAPVAPPAPTPTPRPKVCLKVAPRKLILS